MQWRIRLIDLAGKKYFYSIVFLVFTVVSFLPPIAQEPYIPQDTQLVIIELLKVALKPFMAFGILFHIATIILVGWMLTNPKATSRPICWYIGIDLVIIALAQSFGTTETYGKVIHTGGLATFLLLGILWIWVALKGEFEPIKSKVKKHSFLLLPFAILSFWSPYRLIDNIVLPDFNPLLLFTSPDYGLTFCFTAPVFLFILYVLFPEINIPVYRITAFVGLLYALFNLSHWFNPDIRWMGFLHIPLLVLSIAALIQTRRRSLTS
jgi:hypothetical protein